MFSAKFQTFDLAADPAAAAPTDWRTSAPDLKWDGLDGFVVPRADRHQNEYVPDERGAAGLADRLHRLGRLPDRVAGPGRSCSPTAATPCRRANRPTRRCSRSSTSSRRHRPTGSSRDLTAGIAARLRSLAAYRRRRRAARQGLRESRARRWSPVDDNPIDEIWSDRPAPPLGAVTLHDTRLRRCGCRDQACGYRSRDRQSSAPTRWWCRTRTTSPGPSTSAAPMSRIRRCRSPSRSFRRQARPQLFIDGRKLSNAVRDRLGDTRRSPRAGQL